MQTWKRFLAALLALTMVTSYIPAPAYAEEIVEEVIEEEIFEEVVEEIEEEAVFEEVIEEPDVEEIVEEEIVEEIDIVVTDTVQGAQVVKGDYGELINPNAWGYCGSSVTNVTWGVYPGGTLVISGEGAMDDFGLYEKAGWWNEYPISHVIVEEGVTSIGNWAFDSEYSWHTPLLETVELASSVTSIGIGAFENCVELSAINLDYVKYISTSAFEGCTALTEVALTSLTELDSEAFKGCTGLTDLTLPGTVGRTSYAVGNESFMNCTGLTSVTVQEGVKWLGERIFDGCTKLQSISLPASLLDIGQNAFDGCTRLKEVHIADLQSWCKMNLSGYFSNNSNELANPLYYGADLYVGGQLLDNLVIPEGTDVQNSMNNFVGCGSIRSVTFPAMEGKYINWIIRNCSGIQHIYFQGSAPQGFTSDAFTGITATAYYPATDESWTEDLFKNYGGSITWEPDYGDEDYQITLGGTIEVNSKRRSGTGWSYDPKTNVLTLDGDFSGTVDSARVELTIEFDGNVATESITGVNLTLKGKTGRDVDALKIEQGGIKTVANLTIENLNADVSWLNHTVSIIDVTGRLTVRNAHVTGNNLADNCGNNYGIKAGSLHVENGSYVHGIATSDGLVQGIYTTQSGSSFSDDCHVVGTNKYNLSGMNVKGITLPEYAYFGKTPVKKASAECLQSGSLYEGHYVGLNHAAYVQDAEGENHQLICDCGTELGEPVACSGENGICADCGEKYGVVDGACGDNVTWELEKSTGVLTVSGEGPMYDYSYNGYSGKIVPWADWTDQITKVVVTSGVTSVGNYAFGQVSSSLKYTKLAEVVLADTVTAIGYGAFYALQELTDIDLSAVTALHDSAFSHCAKLESVTFCDELKVIPGSAFYSCRSMENVTLPAKLETIGESAFSNSGLVNLVIPEKVTTIDYEAFSECYDLETVTLPASLTTLGYAAFAVCENLKEITFLGDAPAEGQAAFYDVYGATGYYPADAEGWDEAYFENLGGTINWVAYYPTSGTCGENLTWSFDKDTGVLTISGSGAMEFTGGEAPWEHYKSQIKILNLDDDITTIADYAFNYYYITGELVLPSKLESIGDGAFSCCFEMTGELVLPDTLTHIGESAFGQCYEITGGVVIPEGVTEIPRYAFSFCAGLSSIEIPGTVTSIGEMAFAGDTLTIIFTGDAPNFDENALGEVHATAYYSADAEGWEEVVKNQYGAASLTWVPMNLTSGSCGEGVTWSMDQENNTLTISGEGDMTDFPSANAAPWYLNYNDTITAVVIEDGVTSVGDYAFGGNSSDYENLVSVTLGDTLERIGKYAFGSCAALTQINLPDSLISIGYYAFSNCTGLTEITLPDSVTELGWGALLGCTGLTAVTLSENLETIGGSAFSNTTGLTTITIPASVTSIERAAFQGTGAGEIIFTGPAPTFGTNPAVFYGITATAYYPADDATWTEAVRTSCGGNITWVAMEPTSGTCGENVTWSFDEDTGVLTISGTGAMDGYYGNTQPWLVWAADITKVVVTDGVTGVGEYAFRDSNGASYAKLTTVELADTVTTIGSNAFEGLRELTAIDLSSVTELGMYAFDHCAKLETVIFSDDLKEIPVDAFDSCSSLKNVRLPAKLERIGQQAFAYCGNAFVDLVVPEGVSAIDFAAFGGCTSLQTLTLPENLTAIGDSAFALCTNLKTITFQGDAPEIHAYAFTSVNGATAYYPVDAEGWENVIGNNYGGTITWVPLEKIIASGMCGDYVHWKLDDQGTLTIYGSGDMRYESVPWANYRNQIKMLVVESGVANLAYNAFADCLRLESVVLPEGLTRIESQVFDRCSGLKSVSLPSTLTEIGFGAFRECSALTTITLPAGLTMLGGCAFESCTNLTGTLEIPSGIKTIDQCTFYECKKLEQIVLPEGLQSIGTSVFVNCTNLRSINIPSGVAEIREFTFQGCSSLESLVLPDDLLQIGMCAFNGCEKLESINIPATVRSIDAYAFQNCTALSGTIEIPSGITEIKEQTFWNCASVESVIIPDSVTTIGNTAFSGCTSLKSITIPSSVTSIGSGVFSGCTALERVDMLGSMTTIEHSLFLGCSSLTSVNLPAGLTRIGDDVFEGCEKLESITIPSGVTEIGAHAFSWCTGLTGITIPSGVKKIEDGTFNSCKSLEKLVIPAGVTSIGYYAFSHCTGLQEITFQGEAPSFDESAFVGTNTTAYYPGDDATWTENVRQNYGGTITWKVKENLVDTGMCGENAYWKLDDQGTLTIYGTGATNSLRYIAIGYWVDHYDQIKKVVVEDGITALGAYSFSGEYSYDNITDVVIAGTVETIGEGAFRFCDNLKNVTLHDGIQEIGNEAFYYCNNITGTLDLPDSITTIGKNAFSFCAGITGTLDLPDGLQTVSDYAFYNCRGLDGVLELPEGITAIGKYAFAGCANITGLVLNDNLETIGERAFWTMRQVTTVTIPDSVTEIGIKAFEGWRGVQEIIFEGAAPTIGQNAFLEVTATAYYPAGDASWTEEVRGDYGGTITWVPVEKIIASGMCGDYVHWNLGELGTMTITGTGSMWDYSSDDVPWISHRTKIKNVVVESGVTSVSDWAFGECVLLKTVSLPEGLTRINNNAFYGCISLTTINLPDSLTSIGAAAFDGCKNLTGITLPENLTTLESCAFSYCTSLTGSLTIPSGVTVIEGGTFQHCYGLTEIILPEGLTSMDIQAFAYCTGLTSITIPEGVAVLEDTVFVGCSGLTEVNLPENLQVIMGGAFSNCNSLPSIRIPADVSIIGDGAFFSCEALDEITFLGSAPDFGEDVFAYVTATAYYPGDNDTWTEEVRQGYGGNITWVPVGGVHTHVFNTDQQCDCGLYGGTCGEGVSWLLNKENGLLTISGDGIMKDFDYFYDWSWKAHKDAITTVVVEEGVTAIGNYAFSGCTALTSVTMAETVARIGESAFCGCTALTDITLHEGITELAQNCFEGCTGLTEITLPQSLTTLGIAAFGSCTGLTEVTIPGNVTAMYSNVFQFCSNLTTATFAEGIADTGDDTFYECDALTTVNLPQSLTRLGDSLFYSCDALKQVTVPAAVREVGEYAFYGCGNLESVTFAGNAPQFNESSFSGTETTVIYPCDDATWTRDVRKNYGGTITWKALYDHENGCGVDLTWAFDESTGKLTITGTGAMTDFAGTNEVPWYDLKDQIQIVEIADGVTTIGSFAFYGCNNILEVYLPEGLTTIGNYGLYYYNNSIGGKSLSIPATVTTLGSDSLWGGEITFLGTVPTTLGSRIMSTGTVWYDGDDTSWEEETVRDSFGSSVKWMPLLDRSGVCGDDLTWTLTKDGLLTVTGTGNMYETPNWSDYMDQIKKVVISEGVTYIGARAFQDAENLTEAEIAGTVNTIGEDAFQGCKKLSSVTMEYGVKTIGNRAFNQCDALEEIFLPDSVAYIGYYAFAWNENLKEITMPMAISSISTGAFAGASALKRLTFLGGAPSLVKDAFDEDVTLTIYYPADDVSWTPYVGSNYDGNITWVAQKGDYIAQGMCGPEAYWKLDHESKLTVYGSGAMSDWSYYDSTGWINSYKTQITTLVVEDGITVLGQNRFSGLTNLKNVELADSITTIVGGTFTNCGFETLELPENLKDIGSYAFQKCSELSRIVLPDSLETLNSYAFLNCGKLTDVTFGKNLKTIGGKAFSGCALLENVVWGSEILETIGDEAFRDCTKLTGDLIFPATLVSIGETAFNGCAGLTGKVEIPSGTVGKAAFAGLRITTLVLGDKVSQIGDAAFANCTALTGTLTIPNSVTEIGEDAFICCTGYTGLQLGNSLRKIGSSAFSCCEKIRVKLTLPESLEEIGGAAFNGCKMIYGLTLNSGLKQLGGSAFYGCSGIRGELVIPAGITEIQSYTFYGCSGLTKLTMHDDIRIIEHYAFDGCTNLAGELKLPENLESIGLQAFYGCTKLTGDLIIPSGVKTINDNAFRKTGVTSLQFGSDGNSSLETIGYRVFDCCTALTGSVKIPDSVKIIGNYAFQGCSGLTELKLGSGVETIENGAFSGCTGLAGTLVVPDSIVTIGAEAFARTGFSKVILGKDLWEIGTTANTSPQSNAFVGCGNLEQIIFTGVEFYPFINSGFEQVTGLKTILVPEDARTDYEIEIGERMPVGASIVGYRAMIGYDCYENLTAALNSASSEDVITMMSDDLTPTFVNQEVTIDKNGFAINAHPGKSYDEKPGETEGTVTFFAVSAQLNDAQKYITLQEAVNAAKTGDTITLLAGDQTAHVENKELTIVKGEFTATVTAGEGYKVEPTDTGYVVKKGANAPEFEYSMQASLNLESEVSMNVGFKFTNQSTMDDAERADVMGRVGLLIWDAGTVNEENATYENHSRVVFDIENVSYNSEKDRFEIRTEGIAAKRLGDSIDFRAFYRCEDGTYVYSRLIKNYSPKKYCYNRMGSGDQNEVNLMVAILNYGAAAQIYFGHHTDALMNADLTEEQKQIKWDGSLVRSDWNVPDEKAGKFVRSPEIISRGANLSLEGAIDNTFYAKADGSVNVAKVELLYWKEADYHNISVLTEDNVSGVIAMEYVEATGRYEGTYSKMAAKEIFSAIYACAVIIDVDGNTYYSGVVAYSPERFGYINQSKPNVALANLAKNVVIYGDAARTFFYG